MRVGVRLGLGLERMLMHRDEVRGGGPTREQRARGHLVRVRVRVRVKMRGKG